MPACEEAKETSRSIPQRWKGRVALGSAPLSMLSYYGLSTELLTTGPPRPRRMERPDYVSLWLFSALPVDELPSASRGDEELSRSIWKHSECILQSRSTHTLRLGCPPFARPHFPSSVLIISKHAGQSVIHSQPIRASPHCLAPDDRIILPLLAHAPYLHTMGPAITPLRQVGRTHVDGVAQLAGIAFSSF